MRKLRTAIPIVVAVVCACGTAAAQPKEPSSLAECAAIESAVARLDCFDALARRERAGGAPGREARADGAPAREARSAPPQSQSNESARLVPRDAVPDAARASRREARAAEREQHEVTSHVTALREIQPGRLEVTLANGQVWRQTNTDRYNLLVGHEVRVYPSGFGQYFRLSSKEARGFIQVERVR